MIAFRVDAASFRTTVANLSSLVAPEAAIDAVSGALAGVLFAETRENLSATDHSLADLADLDHPYARRHGRIQVHGADAQRVVHKRTGAMLASLRTESLPSANSPTGEAWAVWFDVGAAPHAAFVVQGTRYMLPRDVLWATAADPQVQKKMMKAVTTALGPVLRSKASVRFGSV